MTKFIVLILIALVYGIILDACEVEVNFWTVAVSVILGVLTMHFLMWNYKVVDVEEHQTFPYKSPHAKSGSQSAKYINKLRNKQPK